MLVEDPTVYQDKETGVWVARAADGTLSQGESEAEARAALKEAIVLLEKHRSLQ